MFESQLLKRHGRFQVPAPLLTLMTQAERAGSEEILIVTGDQLGPMSRLGPRYLQWGGKIGELAPKIMAFAPPDRRRGPPILTMAPDKRDWMEHPPNRINRQWWKTLSAAMKGPAAARSWSGSFEASCRALDRNHFYDMLPDADMIIQTQADEPYGNLAFRLNPSGGGGLLQEIPREIPLGLVGPLSLSGHSQRILLTGSGASHGKTLGANAKVFKVKHPTSRMLQVLSRIWLPDQHAQRKGDKVQKALCVSGAKQHQIRPLLDTIGNVADDWLLPEHHQTLTDRQIWNAAQDFRTLAVIEAKDDIGSARSPVSFLMVNWISGYAGGF